MRSKQNKYKIKKGDTITCITGEDAGKSGRVLQVFPLSGRVLVEGIHLVKKHMRKTQDNPNGGIVEIEAPLAISNVRLNPS